MSGVRPRLEGIDGVRGLAVAAVVAYHVDRYTPLGWSASAPAGLGAIVTHLWLGVTVFFVLSGFLLFRPYAAASLAGEPLPSLRRYARRRFLRIVPGYYLALTVLIATLHPRLLAGSPWGWLKDYLFLQIYFPESTETVIGPAWTLCIEVAFYAFLPLYAAGLHRLARRGAHPGARARVQLAGIGVLAVVGLAYRCAAAARPGVLPLALPQFLDLFAVGMALAVGLEWSARGATLARASVRLPLAACALTALALPLAHPESIIGPGSGPATALFDLLIALATACALGALLLPEREPRALRLLTLPLLARLGTISYGVYLWHEPLLTRLYWRVLLKPVHAGALGMAQVHVLYAPVIAAMLALTLATAALSWRLVESPLLSLRRRA